MPQNRIYFVVEWRGFPVWLQLWSFATLYQSLRYFIFCWHWAFVMFWILDISLAISSHTCRACLIFSRVCLSHRSWTNSFSSCLPFHCWWHNIMGNGWPISTLVLIWGRTIVPEWTIWLKTRIHDQPWQENTWYSKRRVKCETMIYSRFTELIDNLVKRKA